MVTSAHRSQFDHAIAMRLRVPAVARDVLSRDAVNLGPEALSGVRLILFRAPSGYGKTVAMSQLRGRFLEAGRACVWITLDGIDNDAARLLLLLSAAVTELEEMTRSGGGDSDASASVIDRLAALRLPFALFIDEAEGLREDGALDLLRELLQEMPANGLVVIGTQVVPRISLARYRLQGQVVEFRPSDLQFSLVETERFLRNLLRIDIDPADIQRLQDKTEGWPAGLRMASAAMRQRASIPGFIDRFSGSDLAIGEYLTEAFLSDLSPDIWSFLLRTSILAELSPALCQALCPDLDAAAILRDLAASNVLITPLDGPEPAYRYHNLLAGYLAAQLRQHMAGDIAALHRRASAWLEAAGRAIPAVDHALKAGDFARVAEMVLREGQELLEQGRVQLLRRWLDALPAEILRGHPRLMLMQAWAVCFTSGPAAAQEIAMAPALVNSDDAVIIAERHCLVPMILAMIDDFEGAERAGAEAERTAPLASGYAQATMGICMAYIRATLDRSQEGRGADEGDRPFTIMYAESVRGLTDLQQNRFLLAKARFRIATSTGPHDDQRRFNGFVWAGIPYALTLYEAGDLTGAAHLLRLQLPFAMPVGLADHVILASRHLSRIAFERGEVDRAFEVLVRLERWGATRGLPRITAAARMERARIFLRQGNARAAEDQLARADDADMGARIAGLRLIANDLETLPLAHARHQLQLRAPEAALAILTPQLSVALAEGRARRALVIRLLEAAARFQQGRTPQAFALLQQALPVCAREEYHRLLVDEGQPLANVLHAFADSGWRTGAASRDERFAGWFGRLIAALPPAETPDGGEDGLAAPLAPLTPKELQLLNYLAEGYSNAAMSEKLYVSDSTVRTHLRNINSKLGVTSRARAVVVARRMKLIP